MLTDPCRQTHADDLMLLKPPMQPTAPRVITDRSLQFQGSPVAQFILRRLGWTIRFSGLPGAQGVIVVYPHTSNIDFILGILAKWSFGFQANFWGKDTLFRIPVLGAWMRWLGGVPVNRSAPGGLVEQAAQHLRDCRSQGRYTWLVVAPEGTRKLTAGWRSGFYRVAVRADVPVGVAAIDYGRREIRLDHFLHLSGDQSADMSAIEQALLQPRGYRHDQASPVRLIQDPQRH